MKILFCTYSFVDYGMDTLFDGLCRALGSENVFDYPEKPSLHSEKRNSYLWYPSFFEYPIVKTDEEKIDMLVNGEIDAVIVGCRSTSDFREGRYGADNKDNFLELLRLKKTPVFLVDYDDSSGINYALIDELKPLIYFKREYLKDTEYLPIITPLSFSYSEKYIPENVATTRANTLFWAGKTYPNREPFIKAYEEIHGRRRFNKWKQDKYSQKLLLNRIGLNLKGFGSDTVRYWELPAHGTLLLSQRLDIVIENDFVDGESALFFDTVEEMKSKVRFCMNNGSYADSIRSKGHEHFKKFHTSKARAEQLLYKIKKVI